MSTYDKILALPPEQFATVCAAVDKRRGGETISLEDKAALIINAISVEKLQMGVETGIVRGDAAMLGKVLELIEKARSFQAHGDLTVNIEHYEVPDVAIPHIVKHCALEQYLPIEEAVMERRRKMRNSKPGRLAAKKFNQALDETERELARKEAESFRYVFDEEKNGKEEELDEALAL